MWGELLFGKSDVSFVRLLFKKKNDAKRQTIFHAQHLDLILASDQILHHARVLDPALIVRTTQRPNKSLMYSVAEKIPPCLYCLGVIYYYALSLWVLAHFGSFTGAKCCGRLLRALFSMIDVLYPQQTINHHRWYLYMRRLFLLLTSSASSCGFCAQKCVALFVLAGEIFL